MRWESLRRPLGLRPGAMRDRFPRGPWPRSSRRRCILYRWRVSIPDRHPSTGRIVRTASAIHDSLAGLAFPVDQLELLPGNPHVGDVDAVARSYERFGQRKPITARRVGKRRIVTAGNTQLRAAIKLGWLEIAVVWTDDDDITASAWALADNRTAELGSYDDALLAAMLGYVAEDAALLASTGYTDLDLARLLGMGDGFAGLTDPDEVPERAPAITRPGDVWICGPHRVICGDATDPDVLACLLGEVRGVCLWTDPPYGVEYVGKTRESLTITGDGASGLGELLAGAFACLSGVLEAGAPFYIAAPAGPRGTEFRKCLDDAGWRFHQALVWVKDAFVLGHSDYHYRHEDILYGYLPGEGRPGRGDHTGARWYGDHAQDTVMEIPRPRRSADHPTTKPVELIARCLANSAPIGGIVLDPFGGSGSTLIACSQTGRVARLCEIDPRYVDVILRRWSEFTGQMPVLEATGEEVSFV